MANTDNKKNDDKKASALSIWAFVLALISGLLTLVPVLPVIIGIIGIVFSIKAKNEIRRKLPILSLILNIIFTLLGLINTIYFIVILVSGLFKIQLEGIFGLNWLEMFWALLK